MLSKDQRKVLRSHLTFWGVPTANRDRLLTAIEATVNNQNADDVAVDRFAAAMKLKLAVSRAKGRCGWQTCHPEELSSMLKSHVEKGDPIDVGNFCMMLWNLDSGIAPQPEVTQPAVPEDGKLIAAAREIAEWPINDAEAQQYLPAWRKFAELICAPQPAPAEPLARFCPGCGSVGPVDPKFRDCCPDGNKARLIPKRLAEHCHDLFQLALGSSIDLSDDTMRAIRTRALDEFGVGQAQGEVWDQILMRETARTIQAAAKGGA